MKLVPPLWCLNVGTTHSCKNQEQDASTHALFQPHPTRLGMFLNNMIRALMSIEKIRGITSCRKLAKEADSNEKNGRDA